MMGFWWVGRMSIYKSVSVSFVVPGVPVGFEAVQIDYEFWLGDEEVVVEAADEFALERIDFYFGNASDFGVELVLVVVVVCELGGDHHGADEQTG
jgi:hypothetical protein